MEKEENGSFNAKTMKITGIVIVTIDLFLFMFWLGGGFYYISKLQDDICFTETFITHYLVLIHFCLAMFITSLVDDILKEEHNLKARNKTLPLKLPYNFYKPFTFIFTSILAFFGDLSLLVYAIRQYILLIGINDQCQIARSLHIAFDVIAVFVSLISIIWFTVFSFKTIENSEETKRRYYLIEMNKRK